MNTAVARKGEFCTGYRTSNQSKIYDKMIHTNTYMSPDNVQNKYPRQTYLAAINVFIEHLSSKGLSADVPHLQSHMSITYTRSKESIVYSP